MNITRLSWQNLVSNPLNTTLSLLLMTFGVGIISLLLLLNNQIEQQLKANLKGVDMVVGAKGSPLQLILSTIYHIDNPTGNISYKEANKLKKNSLVDLGIPLSYGDTYNGFRIVGTTHQYPELYEAKLKEGELWSRSLEVVLGSTVADANQLKLGDTFYGTHGLVEGGHVHDDYSYEVVGILKPSYSTIDQLILTNTQSVWKVHHHEVEVDEHHDHHNCDHDHHHHEEGTAALDETSIPEDAMITAMIIKFKSPVGFIQLPRKVNETTNLQAALPALEISRLTNLLGFGIQTINTIAFIIIIVSGLSIFISLYNSLKKRRYELALMRVHGATKWQLVKLVLQEGMILSVVGTIFGLLTSRITLFFMSLFVQNKYTQHPFDISLLNEELWLFPIAIFIGLAASLIPTILSYNINIPKTLSNA
ncbi:ABC transporter permease [Flavobacteriales bacterium]|jgi:putative ABC transport system permease protein|nr:ABC transporter permease [Flavobacteriales bacterium]